MKVFEADINVKWCTIIDRLCTIYIWQVFPNFAPYRNNFISCKTDIWLKWPSGYRTMIVRLALAPSEIESIFLWWHFLGKSFKPNTTFLKRKKALCYFIQHAMTGFTFYGFTFWFCLIPTLTFMVNMTSAFFTWSKHGGDLNVFLGH